MEIGRRHMPHARSLPFLLYLDSEGRFVHGTQGGVSAHSFREDLERVAGVRADETQTTEER